MRRNTLIGEIFGQLTVLEQSGKNTRGERLWKCLCTCGNYTTVPGEKLTSMNTRSCGCLKTPNMIGQIFGNLTVIEDAGLRTESRVWLCKCSCGGDKIVSTTHLKKGNVRSCGCLRSGNLTNGIRNLGKGVAARNRIIDMYKKNAVKTGRVFKLTVEQCELLFQGNCYYCGESPNRTFINRRTKDSYTYNGIDRVNNSQGYVLDNVVSCCTTCNLKKGSSSQTEFLAWIKKIAINHLII